GRNIAGIKTAANGVFGIEPKKLNLPQAAYLAGLPQSPTYYTPYLQNGEIKSKEDLEPGIKRMKYVLKRMRHVGFISEKEYTEALDYDITKDFEKKSNLPNEKYPTLVYEAETRARDILMEQFAKEDKLSMKKLKDDKKLYEKYYKKADVALRREGYQIHTTINKKMFNKMQKVAKDYKYYGPDKPETVKDEKTGKNKKIYKKYYKKADVALRRERYQIHTTINKKMFNKMQKVAKDYKYYGPDKPETVKDEKTGKNKEVKESIQVGSILIENKTGRII